MTKPVILALDSGTSVVKAVAFDPDGSIVASAARPNAWTPLPGNGAEQDMARSWDDAVAVLSNLAADLAARFPDREVAGLGVTGQGDGTWMIDSAGDPVGAGWIWLDARAAAIVEELKASGAASAAFPFTGTGLAACQQAPQLLWMERHRPEALARVATAFHPKDYLYFRATGVRATSPCEGCFTFGDFRIRQYRDEVLRALGLSHLRHLLPPMLDGTTVAHPLARDVAERTGLKPGLPVMLGAVDVVCTALGAGIYGAGDNAGVSIVGSTGMHIRLVADVAHVAPSPLGTGYCIAFPVPGHTLQAQTNMAATLNIDWLADLAADAASMAGRADWRRADILGALNAAALSGRPGAAMFHPFISAAGERGPFTDATARAAILGLDQSVRLGDLARAVFEGLCFAARDCYVAIGGAPGDIRLTGGAARSDTLRAILASVLDRPVRGVSQPEAGAAGVAMMAAVQLGLYQDMAACARDWVTPRLDAPVQPEPSLVRLYDRLFPLYRDAYLAQTAVWRGLSAVRGAADAA